MVGNPIKHTESSTRKFGGKRGYLSIHNWFDECGVEFLPTRRCVREFSCAKRCYGAAITNSEGKAVPVRYVGEQHVKEDLGRIPTAQDWLMQIKPQRWMHGQRLDNERCNS